MNLDDLKRLLKKNPKALEYALERTGSSVEGYMWEYDAAASLAYLGFTSVQRRPTWTLFYDYVAFKDGRKSYISVKLHAKEFLRAFGHLSLRAKKAFAKFLIEEGNVECFYVLSKDGGLIRPDAHSLRMLRRRLKEGYYERKPPSIVPPPMRMPDGRPIMPVEFREAGDFDTAG